MTASIVIRPAAPGDAETIIDFNQRLAWESERKQLDAETLRRGVAALFADESRGRYFVACLGEQIVGQLMLTYEWSDWRNGQIWWIQSVYVPPEHRRLGVFRGLHAHVRRLAQEEGQAVGLRLYVEQNNEVARQVYRQLGLADAGYLVLEDMFVSQQSPSARSRE